VTHRSLRIFARRLFKTLSVLSLLLCLATVTLWVRSYRHDDAIVRTSYLGAPAQSGKSLLGFTITSDTGILEVLRWKFVRDPRPFVRKWQYVSGKPGASYRPGGFLGFATERSGGPEFSTLSICFPHWSLAVLFALLPIYSAISFIRHRKHRLPGHCRSCGYDLRATPDRCPECGQVAE
jgi:hypothetical protein